MNKNSRVLIDEVVLPDVNAHWHGTMGDLMMMILYAGKERTRSQWEKLVSDSGLKISLVHTYNVSGHNSILVLELV